jgi:hypothetical protein
MPYRGLFFQTPTDEGAINWRQRELFDSTAVLACQNLAANIHSALTNPIIRWFNILFRDERLNNDQAARAWIEEATKITFMALQESNFNLEASETYLDLCGFGSSCMVEEVQEDSFGRLKEIDFQAIPIDQCYFEQDVYGKVMSLFRKLRWTANQMVNRFGSANVPKEIADKAETDTGIRERQEVVFAVYNRNFGENGEEPNTFQILAPDNRPFGWKYFLETTAEQLGETGGYYEMPAFLARWRKTAGSQWGHSPAMVCLSDVLTLQQLVELILKAAEKVVDPPILTTRRGVFGNIDLEAAGVTVVQSLESIKPFESRARFDVSQLQREELQRSIERTFFVDQLQLKESPAMTATEVHARMQMMQRLLGPTLGRLQADFLDPLVERTFKILLRYGHFPQPPSSVAQLGGELDIEYLGTMARAQRMEEVGAIERWMADLTAMSEQYPQVLDTPNPDEVSKILADSLGVPAKARFSDNEIKYNRLVKQRQLEQQQQILELQAAGQGMESLGKGMKEIGLIPETTGSAQ